MKKSILMITLLIAATGAFAAPQTNCPIMGFKVNKNQYADVNGYRIYVCCKSCIKQIEDASDEIIKKMKADGVTLEKTPEK